MMNDTLELNERMSGSWRVGGNESLESCFDVRTANLHV